MVSEIDSKKVMVATDGNTAAAKIAYALSEVAVYDVALIPVASTEYAPAPIF